MRIAFAARAAIVVAIAVASPAKAVPAGGAQQSAVSSGESETSHRLTDATERQGPFSIGSLQYTVVLQKKVLHQKQVSETTVAGLRVLDAQGDIAYEATFPYAVANGGFSQSLSASATLLPGSAGAGLLIRFIEQHAGSSGAGTVPAKESWQIFGVVNGKLTAFGAVLPLGQGRGITVGGVVTGVMVRGGIAVVPLASTAEALGFRAWEGNFYVFVPVRVDWENGEWGEGEECYQLVSGILRARGCRMGVEADRVPQTGGGSVRLFAAPDGDTNNSQVVAVEPESQVKFVAVLARTQWNAIANRVECNFSDVWLEMRIGGEQGWVHGEEAFEALGLPAGSPK